MQTNAISIVDFPPVYSPSNVDLIMDRIHKSHPNFSDEARERYFCDLLNVNEVDEIRGSFLVFQEIEPAVSQHELKQLAERVVGYYNGVLTTAIYTVRNVLNTVPRSLEDLIDYSTPDRIRQFIHAFTVNCPFIIVEDPNKIQTIEDLQILLKDIDRDIIDLVCGLEMQAFQSIPVEKVDGLTATQRYLFFASNYYLNHMVGFKTNSLWLAAHITNQYFGCDLARIHKNGELCAERHFSFKDGKAAISMVKDSMTYITGVFNGYVKGEIEHSESNERTISLYKKTLLSVAKEMVKTSLQEHGYFDPELTNLITFLTDFSEILDKSESLMLATIMSMQEEDPFVSDTEVYLMRAINEERMSQGSGFLLSNIHSKDYMMTLLALYNETGFFTDDSEKDNDMLSALLLRSEYEGWAILRISEFILDAVINKDPSKKDIKFFECFYDNHLWRLVNENSDTLMFYDEIYQATLGAKDFLGNTDIIEKMAELGHIKSMIHMTTQKSGKELAYWKCRVDFIEKIPIKKIRVDSSNSTTN